MTRSFEDKGASSNTITQSDAHVLCVKGADPYFHCYLTKGAMVLSGISGKGIL